MPDHIATAVAHANFALVKYWGKRNTELNLPAVGSLSLTISELHTTTSVQFDPDLGEDCLILDGSPADHERSVRVSRFLDRVRERAGLKLSARVKTSNTFPAGAGLASSASGFAALAVAACHASGLTLSDRELSALARLGSGSAARSIFGGFVEMDRGEEPDGSDAVAKQLAGPDHWDLAVLVVITDAGVKALGSTEAMERSRLTSPYYAGWCETHSGDLETARNAIRARDFDALTQVVEHNCMKMHAVILASNPPVLYWNETTVAVLHAVQQMRNAGIPVCYTMDAGPQVKVLTPAEHREMILSHLLDIPGVMDVIVAGPGPGVRIREVA